MSQLQMRIQTMTVIKATELAFKDEAEVFTSYGLCQRVRRILNSQTMDGTILRKLRQLRKDGKLNYDVTDQIRGFYKKK